MSFVTFGTNTWSRRWLSSCKSCILSGPIRNSRTNIFIAFAGRKTHLRCPRAEFTAKSSTFEEPSSRTTPTAKQHTHQLFEEQLLELKLEQELLFEEPSSQTTPTTTVTAKQLNHQQFEEQLLELKLERESLFGFTEEERTNWSSFAETNNNKLPFDEILKGIEAARSSSSISSQMGVPVVSEEEQITTTTTTRIRNADNNPIFTHLNSRGDSINMVDVGSKSPTRRVARARTKVFLPPEVMVAFSSYEEGGELIGPKGPIFSTAKIAGIIGAKRTSELIPLCHPLSLDKVHIDITLDKTNSAIIVECECSVTACKTGVEMEALLGASIAALTIYDMVKAVSHRVRIECTELIFKTGGKRDVRETTDGEER